MPVSDWSPWFRLLLAVLATWRLAHLIAKEDGPFDIIVRLRGWAGQGVIGELMDCPYCLSLWLAIPFACVLAGRPDAAPAAWGMAWLAISGGACMLEGVLEGVLERDVEPASAADGMNSQLGE